MIVPKIIISGILAASLIGCDGIIDPTTDELIKPVSYEVDGWGTNPDLYEFTPKGNPKYFCILAVSGTDELKSIFCMPKKDGG